MKGSSVFPASSNAGTEWKRDTKARVWRAVVMGVRAVTCTKPILTVVACCSSFAFQREFCLS